MRRFTLGSMSLAGPDCRRRHVNQRTVSNLASVRSQPRKVAPFSRVKESGPDSSSPEKSAPRRIEWSNLLSDRSAPANKAFERSRSARFAPARSLLRKSAAVSPL
jgi:hypothetical protein